MQNLPYTSLRALAAVYQTGGIRSAARQLHVSHSAVCRHLRNLEGWLHVPLFEPRNGSSKLTLSPHADALGRAAVASLSELDRAVNRTRERKRPNSVVIGTTASFAARWLIPRLAEFQRQHGWIEVSIVPVQAVLSPRDQGADIVIRMGPGPWLDEQAEPLMNDCLFPVAEPSYWSSLPGSSAEQKLANAKLLHDRDPAAVWPQWSPHVRSAEVDLLAGPRFASSDLVLDAAAAGLGVALARGRLAEQDVESGRLIRPFGDLQIDLGAAYWLVRAAQRAGGTAEELAVGWIREKASGLGGDGSK